MSSNQRRRRGEVRPEIEASSEAETWALDPKDDYAESRSRTRERKERMLCAQVGRALEYALVEEVPHLVEYLMVEEVAPYPNGGRLLVLLREVAQDEFETQELQQRLRESGGRLRASVASYVNRKRAPELVFVVIGAEEVEVR